MDAGAYLIALLAELEVLQGTGLGVPPKLWPRMTTLAGAVAEHRVLMPVNEAYMRGLLEVKVGNTSDSLGVLMAKIEALEAVLGISNFPSDSRAQLQTDSLSGSQVAVPQRAEQLMYLVLPRRTREAVLGDLAEEYQTIIVPKFGVRYATRWYWLQVVKSIGPTLWASARRAVELVWILKGGS